MMDQEVKEGFAWQEVTDAPEPEPEATKWKTNKVKKPKKETSLSMLENLRPKVQIKGALQEEQAFEVWYTHDRHFGDAATALGCPVVNLKMMSSRNGWVKRAEDRDREITALNAKRAAERYGDVIDKHYDVGNLLIDAAVRFIKDKGINTEREAINAIKVGTTLQRQASALPEWMSQIQKATDEALVERLMKVCNMVGLKVVDNDDQALDAEFSIEHSEDGEDEGEGEDLESMEVEALQDKLTALARLAD